MNVTDRAIARIDELRIPRKIDFEAYYENLPEAQDIHGAEEYVRQVIDLLYGEQAGAGMTTPWTENIKFRPREYTTWTGEKGVRKSSLISQCFLHGMVRGERCLVISPEFTVPTLLARKLRQASGGPEPSMRFIEHWLGWCRGKLWFFDHQGALRPKLVLGVIAYAVKHFAVTQVLVDSLMKCGIPPSDYDGQAQFCSRLQSLAHQYGPHIHLVTHARKRPAGERGSKPDIHDTKGTSEINDLAENCMFVAMSERKRAEALKEEHQRDAEIMAQADIVFGCQAQRNGSSWTGVIPLWQEERSHQFVDRRNGRALYYAPCWSARQPGDDFEEDAA